MTEESPKLPQEDIDKIVRLLERIERRRKILIAGYAVAALVMIIGEIAALYVVGNAPRGRFMGWVFLVPFSFTGAVLWAFGRWANSLKVRPGP